MQNYSSSDSSHWNEASENVLAVHFPLHRACRDGDLKALVNYIDNQPLEANNLHGFRAVFEEDTFYGWTPIHYAAYFGRLACLRKLLTLETFINPDVTTSRFRQTPCHLAAFGGSVECLKWLLDSRASIFAQDYLGETPVHKAARSGSIECLSLLVAHGANISSPNNAGQKPLDVAELCNQKECAGYLRQSQLMQNKTCWPSSLNEHTEKTLANGTGVFSYNGKSCDNNSSLITFGGYGYSTLTNGAVDGPIVDDVMADHGVASNVVPVAGRKRTRATTEDEDFTGKRLKLNNNSMPPMFYGGETEGKLSFGFTMTNEAHGCIF